MSFRLALFGGFFFYVIVMPAAPDWTGGYGEGPERVDVYKETSTHLLAQLLSAPPSRRFPSLVSRVHSLTLIVLVHARC